MICKYKSRSKKFTCPFGLVPMKFHLSNGRITCPGLRASGLRRRLCVILLQFFTLKKDADQNIEIVEVNKMNTDVHV